MISFAVKSSVQCSPAVLAQHSLKSAFFGKSQTQLENTLPLYFCLLLCLYVKYCGSENKTYMPSITQQTESIDLSKRRNFLEPRKKMIHLLIKENCVSKVMVTLHVK